MSKTNENSISKQSDTIPGSGTPANSNNNTIPINEIIQPTQIINGATVEAISNKKPSEIVESKELADLNHQITVATHDLENKIKLF
ncbi:MAG: hypothetical protein ACK4PR_12210, partial [Gammaproteobacteria bacterium]